MKPNIEAIKSASDSSSAGQVINKSGLYTINIVKAYMKTKEGTGAKTLNLRVNVNGSEGQQVLFIKQTNNNGKESFEKILLDKLLVVCGIEEVKRLIPTKFTYKNKEYMEDCIKELENKELIVQVKQEFSKWNGQIKENFKVINFFRSGDKATAAEIVNEDNFGKKYHSLDESYINATSYKDGVTETQAKLWLESRKNGNQQTSVNNNVDENDEIPF